MAKRHHIPEEHFMEQFHNHHHYAEYGPEERRPEWWELPEPRARGGRVDFGHQSQSMIDHALNLLAKNR